jgi:peptide methionine sulfoxide reductase MsrB
VSHLDIKKYLDLISSRSQEATPRPSIYHLQKKMRTTATTLLLAATASAASVPLVTFDNGPGTTHTFSELNDPVMGGKSTGTFTVSGNSTGIFQGQVNIVPSLKAPGFIETWADDHSKHPYADASSAVDGDLVLVVRSDTPDYKGFHVSFAAGALIPNLACAGGGSFPGSSGCYKTSFVVPKTDAGAFTEVRIPFSQFTDKWSPSTGKPTKLCSDDISVCPTKKALSNIQALGFWGEGVEGKLHLEIKSVSADTSSSTITTSTTSTISTAPPAQYNTCKGPIQKNLRYNVSSLGNDYITAPVALNKDETLADATCCDSRVNNYAEPRFLFESPYVALYSKMNENGTTNFYDAQCGLLLFTAPISRTFNDFQKDTNEHGWPSFRPDEVHLENFNQTKWENGDHVYSNCGTHLGSFLPDATSDRWCMDVSCLSGNPM